MPAVLGVDLGATNLRVALGDERGLVARAAEPVPGSGEALAARVAAIARARGPISDRSPDWIVRLCNSTS